MEKPAVFSILQRDCVEFYVNHHREKGDFFFNFFLLNKKKLVYLLLSKYYGINAKREVIYQAKEENLKM